MSWPALISDHRFVRHWLNGKPAFACRRITLEPYSRHVRSLRIVLRRRVDISLQERRSRKFWRSKRYLMRTTGQILPEQFRLAVNESDPQGIRI